MPEIINITHDELRATYKGVAPEGFRFALQNLSSLPKILLAN